ncbi:LacI family DNA-binding transcriptional regulator [Poseidonocella sp. HB161398]|uniref:LacI family DNA-binding transcriptional regulator n=1 Tax=Poseidonocella sp. HB161398 TaxID=2320855 RepID=UPI0014865988|nr:LacI family DNA-binding transcriptional regulator [Poseidonocella sp. HB161398]
MTSKTTLTAIAEAAGVSLSTVDRVINRRGGVSPKAEARVLEWASKLELDRRLFRAHLPLLRIAVVMYPPENPFFAALREAFSALDTSMADLRMSLAVSCLPPTEIEAIERRIAEAAASHDGLVICCPDHPRLADALRRASQRIPVVTLVTDVPASGRIAYVGPDNRQIGRVAGELMGRFLGREGGKVLVMLGLSRIQGHQDREIGFRSVLRERFPACRIVEILESEEDRDRAGRLVRRALADDSEIRGIYNVSAGNHAMAQSLRALGLEAQVTFITHELTPVRRQLLRDGLLDAVIDQNPRLEAIRAVDILADHFRRSEKPLAETPFTPFEIYLRENCPGE